MPRTSTKKDKSIYQVTREELGLSREKASELLETIQPERLERIENAKYDVRPDEVLLMAEKYQAPHLCNYYCANECPIGKETRVPELQLKDLSQIVLEILNSLDRVDKEKSKFINIAVDGAITNDELHDFAKIKHELDQITVAVNSLKLWFNQTIADGKIDLSALEQEEKSLK